jgi:hypothetical protein
MIPSAQRDNGGGIAEWGIQAEVFAGYELREVSYL